MVSSEAVGLIETTGLVAAVEAADTAVKASNVRLVGYELAKGGGWVTVKVCGNVGAVQAAVAAGAASAAKVNTVRSTLILTRPHHDIDFIINSPNNVYFDGESAAPLPPTLSSPETSSDYSGPKSCETLGVSEIEESFDLPADPELPADSFAVTEESDTSSATQLAEQEKAEVEGTEAKETETVPAATASPVQENSCNLCGDPACPRLKGEPRNTCIHFNDPNREG